MKKPIPTSLDLTPLLKERFSPRAFDDKAVEESKIERLLEAARWSPSASNDQPWRFIVGEKGKNENYSKIFDSLVEFNQIWNKTVPVLIVFIADKKSLKTGGENAYAHYDLGQAAAHLTFQASHEGLVCHQMGGFDKQKLIDLFEIPEQFEPVSIISVGYQGPLSVLPDKFQEMEKAERVRKSLDELVYKGSW